MSEFNKDDYLNDLPDADELAGQGAPAADAAKPADSQAAADQPAAPKPEEGPADAGNGDQQDADEDTDRRCTPSRAPKAQLPVPVPRVRALLVPPTTMWLMPKSWTTMTRTTSNYV